MQGQYPPYNPMPPGSHVPPPRPRDGANLVPVFIVLGVLAVALLGAVTFVVVRVAGSAGTDEPIRTVLPSYNPRAISSTFAGTWTGSGYYHNGSGARRTFNATLTLSQGAESGTSAYTGFACSGLLRVESVTPGRVVMAETITQGNEAGGNCADAASGYVTLTTQSSGSVLFAWYSTRQKMNDNDTSSQATLTRQTAGT